MVDLGIPGIQSGAAINVDEDAMAEAANTSLDMEGFETGAGFDLEGGPAEGGRDIEIETMEIRSSAFDEVDFAQAETSGSAEPRRKDPVDHSSLLLPTPTAYGEKPERRHRGLEALARRRRRKATGRWLIRAASAVLIFGGIGLAMAYLGVVEIPGITLPERPRFTPPTPVAPPGPEPETPVMSHVVLVDTWREIQTPLAMADALRERMPNLLGFVTALRIDGDRHFALMVGPAYNAVEANDLKVPLAAAFDLLNPDPESWIVQEAPYSFLLGEYETVVEASDRVRELEDLAVPAFVLEVTYSAEGRAPRVYGGAFSDELQARGMGRLLRENGLGRVPLTERRGRLPD